MPLATTTFHIGSSQGGQGGPLALGQPDDASRAAGVLQLGRHRIEEDPPAAAQVQRVPHPGPIADGADNPLRHLGVQRQGGVEEVRRHKVHADSGYRSH